MYVEVSTALGSLGNPSAKTNERVEFETHAVELQKQLYRIALQIIAEFIKILQIFGGDRLL